jgi:hypothetical protein
MYVKNGETLSLDDHVDCTLDLPTQPESVLLVAINDVFIKTSFVATSNTSQNILEKDIGHLATLPLIIQELYCSNQDMDNILVALEHNNCIGKA